MKQNLNELGQKCLLSNWKDISGLTRQRNMSNDTLLNRWYFLCSYCDITIFFIHCTWNEMQEKKYYWEILYARFHVLYAVYETNENNNKKKKWEQITHKTKKRSSMYYFKNHLILIWSILQLQKQNISSLNKVKFPYRLH